MIFAKKPTGDGSSTRRNKKVLATVGLLASSALAFSSCADGASGNEASGYLDRPLEIYVPASPGGGTDTAARIISDQLEQKYDATVSVVNETGGGGALAVNEVANSGPDENALLFFHEAMIVGQAEGTVQQDILDDFTPLGSPSRTNQYLLVPADTGWEDLNDLQEAAQANPDGYKMGINVGQTSHYVGAMLENETDVSLQLVEAGSESERVNELLGGRLDIIVGSNTVAQQYVESGDMVALAVLSDEPDPAFEEVPTATEQGYDMEFPLNFMLLGPADLEGETVDQWDTMLSDINEDPEYIESMSKVAEPTGLTSEELIQLLEEGVIPRIDEISDNVGEEG